jgi:chromosome partitioning protein
VSAVFVTVTSHKGGVGKTTSTIHLAAYFAREFREGSTVVVDTDTNASALKWAARAERRGYRLPFAVVGPGEEGAEEHVIFDSPGRLYDAELEAVAEVSDLVVVPSAPDALSVDALASFVEDFEAVAAGEVEYKVLLTMVPWWNLSGRRARKDLGEVGVPMFEGRIRFRPAFHTAALEGVPVYEVRTRGAREAWEDYERVGAEVVAKT